MSKRIAKTIGVNEVKLKDEVYSLEYANPLYDTSDPCSRDIFEMFSSEAINHLARLPEKSSFLLAELAEELTYEGLPQSKDSCKLCGDLEHDSVKANQENSFKNRFQVFSNSSEPTAIVEYECYKHASYNSHHLPLFIVTITTSVERHVYEFAGFHMKEAFPICVEDVVFCKESIVKLAFDFLLSLPEGPLHEVKNLVFWDVTPTFRSDRAMQREVLFFYPLSNTYDFKPEVDFLADGHGKPSDDFIIIPEKTHKRYLALS